MATEKGIITEIKAGIALVKTQKADACNACSSKDQCHAGGGSAKEMEVEALNHVGAVVGDRVVIACATGSLLKLSFLLHIFPIICLTGGAVLGHQSALALGLDSNLLSVIFGFGGLILSFFFIRFKGKKMAQKDQYKPTILRVI